MLSLIEMRRRLPLVVFVVLLIMLVVMLGFACLCVSDHPSQAVERAIGAFAQMAAVIEIWSLLLLSVPIIVVTVLLSSEARGRASPAQLQRFLF